MTIDGPALEPDERLIWSARPNPLRYAWTKGWATGAFGLAWTTGTSIAFYHAIQRDWIAVLFALIFVGAGVVMMLSPFWQLWNAVRTRYIVTNKRAVVETSLPFGRRLSVMLNRVQFTDLRPSSGGYGDIYFKETAVPGGEGPSLNREGFIAIADAAEVERTLRRALERAPQ